jgi:hypothetical protein
MEGPHPWAAPRLSRYAATVVVGTAVGLIAQPGNLVAAAPVSSQRHDQRDLVAGLETVPGAGLEHLLYLNSTPLRQRVNRVNLGYPTASVKS